MKPLEWFGAEYSVNLYRGCSHGCIYCDSRSSCYQDFSFDTIKPKRNVISILQDELSHKRKKGIIDTGSMSDPYNPLEEQLCLTRCFLELVDNYDFGVSITTKSSLIERDVDILQRIMLRNPVICELTITTAYDELSKKIEPHAPQSSRRFATLERLSTAGIFSGIVLMPVLPFIEDTDDNVIKIVKQAASAGASFIFPYFGVTLRHNQRSYYYQQLNSIFPSQHYESRYISTFGESYECITPREQDLKKVFVDACNKFHILYKMEDIITMYQQPYKSKQITLFDI